ncbi:hypothetical protein SAMN05444413_103208 [Roseivivax marinus]|uniref:hypothetical protein n=1 Tax=Roseivivax marinus TaxID=1379903 RepID=UPI0008BA6FD0|nr:hypothetical protein [Roseivivax marinus]SEK76685.1 hypothetical protein SAMN05444413_103208 [Roseivivax marinus]
MIRFLSIPVLGLGLAGAAPAQDASPYAGQDTRAIAGLSEERTEGLRTGAGLGYARAAELNGWPGPLHVLELADELSLDARTRDAVEAIRQDMLAVVRPLGEALIAAEADLDALFSGDTAPSPDDVTRATARIGAVEGDLRAAHLAAHLHTAPLLDRHQTMLYARARGYETDHSGPGHQHGQ